MFFYFSQHEGLVILITIFVLFFLVPLLGFIAARMTKTARQKIKWFFSLFRKHPHA